MITPVILAGGSGTRLWPWSRSSHPKQLIALQSEQHTLLQKTIQRCDGIANIENPIVVCNEEHRFMVGEQLQELGLKHRTIILEPFTRDTAPAIALAALYLADNNPNALMLVMPADQVIGNRNAFHKAVQQASTAAQKGAIVTFGIVPTKVNTNFGYIKTDVASTSSLKTVVAFKEKPDDETARGFLKEGGYFWNGGIFLMTASTYLAELEKYTPEIVAASRKAMNGIRSDEKLDFLRIDKEEFALSPSISIDYAVMESTDKALLIPLDADWNDLGSWSALWEVADKDGCGNALFGDVVAYQTSDTAVFSQKRLVATSGVKDLVVVETADAVLVSNRSGDSDIKQLVSQLRAAGHLQADQNRKVYRPWGWYDSIEISKSFQVKRIKLKPRARISVQSHKFRAEHWVVVSGTARVFRGEEESTLEENESTFIPIGMKHSLHNPSTSKPLEIIEVQTGTYFGEDDIERFEDKYGRLEAN